MNILKDERIISLRRQTKLEDIESTYVGMLIMRERFPRTASMPVRTETCEGCWARHNRDLEIALPAR